MIEILYIAIGTFFFYSLVHFAFIQHKRNWEQRTKYQKVITVVSIVLLALYIMGTI